MKAFRWPKIGVQFRVPRPPEVKRPSAHKRGYSGYWLRLRRYVLERDHYTCVTCGKAGGLSMQVDHVVPKRDGGRNEPGNLQTLCAVCHTRKTRRGQ